MTSISVNELSKRYPINSKYCNVDKMDFEVRDGEFFCLVGPSNSGKTSTLRLIAGLDNPDHGTIEYDGKDVSDISPSGRGASLLFDNLALYPNRSGFDNIAHPLKVDGVPEAERKKQVENLASTLGISHLLDRTPETFSGGEKQRVGIARTIISDSTVYLLDEPLGGLDAKLKKRLRLELKRLHREVDGTFIYATHSQEAAMSVADRIAVCKDGSIRQIGTPEELYDNPDDRFVAEFIGSPAINFTEGELSDGSITVGELSIEAGTIQVPDNHYELGIRPHDIVISETADDSTHQATVEVNEPLGSETIVDLSVGGLELRAVSRKSFAKDLNLGDKVGVTLTEEDIYLIDPEDGRVIHSPSREHLQVTPVQ